MKFLTSIVAFLLLTSGLGASVDPYDVVVAEDCSNATLLFRTTIPLKHASEFQLLTADGKVIYKQAIAADAFLNKRLRKDGFPSGEYFVVFTDERGRTEISMTLSRTGFTCDIPGATRTIFPKVDLKDERILVVNYKNESGKRVNVRLTDESGNEIFADRVEGQTIRRSYQLDQLEAGNYTVTVSSKNVKNYTAAIALH